MSNLSGFRQLQSYSTTWSAVAGWLASRTLDPRVVSSNPGRSVTCACVPGQNTSPLIARVFSDRTLKNLRSLLPGVYARGSKRPHSGYINVTCRGLTYSSISWHWLCASCAHHRLRSAVLHDTIIGAAVRLHTCVQYSTKRAHSI